MKPLASAPQMEMARIRFVLTDMDETLTYRGRLSAATYAALERLQMDGVIVIPVTAAPAGWCDQMARMWPVDAVIGENGGLALRREGHEARRFFWSADPEKDRRELEDLVARVRNDIPEAVLAADQPFRLTTLAFRVASDRELNGRVLAALRAGGARTTENNLWLLGWPGAFDKLVMARRVLAELYGLDVDDAQDQVLYAGDSVNDAPMFSFFRHTVGVSTVRGVLDQISHRPAWITKGPGGAGFVETAEAVLAARACRAPSARKGGRT